MTRRGRGRFRVNMNFMQNLRWPLCLPTLLGLAVLAGCPARAPAPPPQVATPAPPPKELPEPPCPPGETDDRSYRCETLPPAPRASALPAPYDQCPAQHEGRPFSPAATRQRREFPQPPPPDGLTPAQLQEYHKTRDWSRDCCYLLDCRRRTFSY